jgi:O-antigen/teichoic acid export membrane protein
MARCYAVTWIVAVLLDTRAAGIFVAYMTIVVLANPLLIGISNVLAPDVARAFAEQGPLEVQRLVRKTTILVGLAVLLLAVVLMVIGEKLIGVLYGAEFTGYASCVLVLAAGMLAEAIGTPAYSGLWAMQRPQACFIASAAGLLATVVATVAFTPLMGLTGAAIGASSGKFVSSLVQCVAFFGQRAQPMCHGGAP